MNNHFQPSEGLFVYVLGLVIVAGRPGRFWLGFVLAVTPIMAGVLQRLVSKGKHLT